MELIKHIDLKKCCVADEILSSNIYAKIVNPVRDVKEQLNENDWIELDNLVNKSYPDFKRKLFLMYGSISENEYKICMLIKCKIGNTKISSLINRDKTSVSIARKRLYEKMFCEKGLAVDLDRFIHSL